MTVTQILPAQSLAGNLNQAQEALDLVRASLPAAGKGAKSFTRIAVQVETPEEVDAFAAEWGVTADWTFSRSMYVTKLVLPTRDAEIEVVYYLRSEAEVAA